MSSSSPVAAVGLSSFLPTAASTFHIHTSFVNKKRFEGGKVSKALLMGTY
jgi:hypothetical protein